MTAREPRPAGVPTTDALWEGQATSRTFDALIVAGGVGFVLSALLTHGALRFALVLITGLIALLGSWFGRIALSVTTTSVRIHFGLNRWPTKVVPLARVVSASAIHLEPLRWGGWGYRWVPWRKATAIVVRRGPALVLTLTSGRRLLVTVDDAEAAADRVNALLVT